MSVIVKLLSKFDDSGIKKAKSGFGGLKKAIGAIGIGIGISQITNLLLDSAKAASADQKSTELLNTQLVRNANATKAQIKQSDKFIEKLSLQTGIMDDDLRPSMGKFVRVTKDVNKAQQLLTLSLDASATTGKPLEKVSNAISQAFVGNRKQLEKLFPTLKTSKDLFGDLEKIVGGAAIQQADPFSKFNNSMDILKEKLGNVVLPIVENFVAEITKPGGLVDQVGKFLEDLSNPKTEVGSTFVSLTDTVTGLYDAVISVVKLVGDLLNMKSSKDGFLADLQGALNLINKITDATNFAIDALDKLQGKKKPKGKDGKPTGSNLNIPYEFLIKGVNPALQIGDLYNSFMSQYFPQMANGGIVKPRAGGTLVNVGEAGRPEAIIPLGSRSGLGSTVNIYVQSADPRAVVDAVSKYVKGNGRLPTAWGI
jgi:hypothetical protein